MNVAQAAQLLGVSERAPETLQAHVLDALVKTYPNIQRHGWRSKIMEAFAGHAEAHEMQISLERVRYEPDAFAIDMEHSEVVLFEVEVRSVLKRQKMQAYAALMIELAGAIKVVLLTVNQHGHINAIDLMPHYADWLQENTK